MKIAVSADGSDLDARVADRFGISAYLIIVDPETMEFEPVPNPGASGKRAAGIQTVVLAISKVVDAVKSGANKRFVVMAELLALGVKGIRLGPTLPAFLSPTVAKVLVEKFEIKLIGDVQADVAAMMAAA